MTLDKKMKRQWHLTRYTQCKLECKLEGRVTQTNSDNNNYQWAVNNKNKETRPLEDYRKDFSYIYFNIDKQRDVLDVFLYLVEYTSKVSESVRRNQHDRMATYLSEIVAWLLALVDKINTTKKTEDMIFATCIQISDAIWMKYPGRCPVCFGGLFEMDNVKRSITEIATSKMQDEKFKNGLIEFLRKYENDVEYQSCKCLAIKGVETRTEGNELNKLKFDKAKKEIRRLYAKTVGKPTNWNIKDVEKMFYNIYGTVIERLHLEDVTNHLQEEVGEVASGFIDMYTVEEEKSVEFGEKRRLELEEELAEELADIFSWTLACLFKIKETFYAVRRYRKTIYKDNTPEIPVEELSLAKIIWGVWGQDYDNGHLSCLRCHNNGRCICKSRLLRGNLPIKKDSKR
jgi:NTP pyrophosphatase (non-canonical NTP hydrolase)